MAVRPFLMWPDKRLQTVAEPVLEVDHSVRIIWTDMLDTMYAMPGVGLAGPQIGVMQRLAVMDCSEGRDEPFRMANPEILHASVKDSVHDEASPNLPGLHARVSRPRAVTVQFLNAENELVERDFVGLWATSVQHQIDHLNGKLYISHLSATKRNMMIAKHNKAMKKRGL